MGAKQSVAMSLAMKLRQSGRDNRQCGTAGGGHTAGIRGYYPKSEAARRRISKSGDFRAAFGSSTISALAAVPAPDCTIDVMSCFENEPLALDFVWPGFVTGTVGTLIAAGSTGKSFWAIEAAMCIASPLANKILLNLDIKTHGKAVILNAEDTVEVVRLRLHAMGKLLSPEARKEVDANLRVESLVGRRVNIMDEMWLDRACEAGRDARLVVLDTHSRWSAGVPENDNAEQAKVLQQYECVAQRTGAGVLFTHHVAKTAALNGQGGVQQAARGAASIIDNCRWAGFLQTMTEEQAKAYKDSYVHEHRKQYVAFGGSKENYGAETPDSWYRRAEGGVLLPVTLDRQGSKPHAGETNVSSLTRAREGF